MSDKKHRNGAKHPMDGTARPVARRNAKPAPVAKQKRRAPAAPVLIPVIRITNPFNMREYVHEQLPWRARKSLAAYFPAATSAEAVVSVNGRIIPREQFNVTYLDRTDNLVICPVPTGGGGSKGILSIVAMIAIAVVTAGAGLAIAGAMGMTGTALTIGGAVIQAGISIAGSMLVNAILAPSTPTPKAAASSSATYGVDGAKNTSLEGIPVPVCYGEFRMAGNVLGMHVENDADDNQSLYMLLSAGEGPVASLTDIEINDNPIVDYKDVEVETRLGLSSQAPIPWFKDNIVADNKNQKMSSDWFYSTTSTAVDQLRFDFVAPQGLCKIDSKSGEARAYSVDLDVQIRPAGSSEGFVPISAVAEIVEWESVTGTFAGTGRTHYDIETGRAYYYDGNDSVVYLDAPELTWSTAAGEVVTDPEKVRYLTQSAPTPVTTDDGVTFSNRVPVYQQTTRITGKKKSAVRRSFTTPKLAPAKYEVRARQVTAKSDDATIIADIYLADINEITLDTLLYPNTALVALKIKLSDQISSMPKVTFMNGGRMVNVYGRPGSYATADQWFTSPSKNPAWVVWDMLTHRRYGGGMATSRLDFPAFKEWAAYCDAQGLQWNGPIDTEMNVWDASQLVLRVGHSQLVNVGTRYTIVSEKASDPVMMFSVANMIEDSYRETWLATNDRANEIDVTFFDKSNSYKQRTVKVYDPAALTAGAKQRTSAITLYGVTDYETAYKEAQFQLNLNRYILKTINFSAPMEAVACSVGDLIYVQTDMTDWAHAGRIDAGSTASKIQLDREVTMEKGKQYKLLVMQDSVLRASGAIYNVAGNSLFLQGFAGGNVKRIQIGGRDLRVSGTFAQGSGFGVVVDDPTGIVAGGTYQLFDTDVIEEYNVVNTAGATTEVQLQTPMKTAPNQFVNWMFGEAEKVKKPFRIKSISGSHEYKRDIAALEYRPEVYDFSRYGSNMPVVPPQDAIIGPARSLTVYEETYISGESVVSSVVASWRTPIAGLYAGADVYVQRNDGPVAILDDAKNRTSSTIPATRGERLAVRVVAYDIFGKRSSYEAAPVTTYTVLGEIQNIDVGDVTGAAFAWSGRDCKITWRYNSTTHSYEFGSEPVGADAGSLDPQFKDYEIRVYDKDQMKLRRTEHTTDNTYTYIYDKNFADGLTRHLVFEIRMRDKFNNVGKPAVLEAYNPPPTVTTVATSTTFESATMSYTHSNDPDFAGAAVYLAEHPDDLADIAKVVPVYSGPDSAILIPGLMFDRDYYARIAPFDAFGMTELRPSGVIHFKTTFLNVDAIADGVLSGSKLIPQLQDRIDLIDAPATTVGSVAARLLEEAKQRGTAIGEVETLVKTGNAQLAAVITDLSAVVDNNVSAIHEESIARADADSAVAATVDALAVKVGNNTAAITNEATARADAIGAEALQRSQQMAQFDTNIRSYVQTYTYSKATADSTINQVYNTLRSEYAAGNRSLESYVQSYSYSKAGADAAIASQVGQVTARLNGAGGSGVTVEQAFSAQASATKGLQGQYTVKIDNNGYVSGFGLASTSVNGAPSSEFIVRADVFGVVMPSYPTVKPFTIGAVNGIPRVIISSALIGDASIGTAQIGNATINNAKIQNAAIDTATIAGNAVTVAASAAGGSSCVIRMNCIGQPVWLNAQGVLAWGANEDSDYGVTNFLTISRDGSVIKSVQDTGGGRSGGTATLTAIHIDNPPAGFHTYTFTVSTTGITTPVASTTAALLETRR